RHTRFSRDWSSDVCSSDLKLSKTWLPRVGLFIAAVVLVDMIYNVMPSMKNSSGDAYPFLGANLIWIATAVVGVGGVCVWAYLNRSEERRVGKERRSVRATH